MNQLDTEQLYNNFIKANSNKYNISINTIFMEFNSFLDSKNFFLTDENANTLDINTISLGKDLCVYIVKKCTDDSKYWKKIN
jgi:hypothetical protein